MVDALIGLLIVVDVLLLAFYRPLTCLYWKVIEIYLRQEGTKWPL